MTDHPIPELLRSPLWNIVLWVRLFNLADDLHEFIAGCLDPPAKEAVDHAIEELIEIGGLHYDTSLTTLGVFEC